MTTRGTSGNFVFVPGPCRKGLSARMLGGLKVACAVFLFCAVTSIAMSAQTFTSLASFDGTNGANPEYMSLVQGFDGDFYGTTNRGGAYGDGAVFKIARSGALTTLYSFAGYPTDGEFPMGLVQATDGNFYGTTQYGGNVNCDDIPSGCGTVFKITPSGTLTTLHSFRNLTDGWMPSGSLVQATDGNLYGTTTGGAAIGFGSVFKITLAGKLTTLAAFDFTDGYTPVGGLVQGADGNLYGITSNGGANTTSCYLGCGTVFKMTLDGVLTTLYNFCSQANCADGAGPSAGLVQATDGNFYGTTTGGGIVSYYCAQSSCGTVFKITPEGTLTTVHSFAGYPADGYGPSGALIQATNRNLYGTTQMGGTSDWGTVFEITPSGRLTILHSFDGTDGGLPQGSGLFQATDGTLYGTTTYGGADGDGTVFSLYVGLGPFVKIEPGTGDAGQHVAILGTDLTGATSVTFNGTAAAFTVVGPSLIETTVPTGATSGNVEVTTPERTLRSNVSFRVSP